MTSLFKKIKGLKSPKKLNDILQSYADRLVDLPVRQFVKLVDNLALADVNTAQNWFGAATDTFALEADVTYEFEGTLRLDRTAGVTSHTTAILFGGTAVLEINYDVVAANPNLNAVAAPLMGSFAVKTANVVTAANTSATECLTVKVRGTIRVTTAGTLIPQFIYSAAPGGAPIVKKNSGFAIWDIGAININAKGNWS